MSDKVTESTAKPMSTSRRLLIVAFVFEAFGLASSLDLRWSVNADSHETARILFCLLFVASLIFFALSFVFAKQGEL